MGRHAYPEPVRLVDEGVHLRSIKLGGLRVLPQHASGPAGHHLDVISASTQLVAYALPDLPRSVRLLVHRLEKDGAGRGCGHDAPAGKNGGSLRQAEPDGFAKDDRVVVIAADVADGGDARAQEISSGVGEHEVDKLAVVRSLAPHRRWHRKLAHHRRVVAQVDVRVDQARHDVGAANVDCLMRRSRAIDVADVCDLAATHRYRHPLARGGAASVDDRRVPEHEVFHFRSRRGACGALRRRPPRRCLRPSQS